ncbi:telomere-associated protein RIF1 [Plodia interpunctella]|uniref:telomere-associated protein RIF1 n=1 Tax=Plodia interpunctella TaxID=58824 RepID=UPI002367D5D7|nr:telomere-associated protein RIF1 [Plodia interpunctella]XP_053625976.1 telomere-associated protein RIF1 [Plodia interpunctella]
MPEDECAELSKALDVLEDNTFDTTIMRYQEFKVIQNVVDSDTALNIHNIKRVLAVCIHNMKDEKRFCGNSLTIVSSILKKINSGQLTTVPDLIPSALAIINILKTIARTPKIDTLQVLSFNTLLSYPDETFVTITSSHITEIMELYHLYCHNIISKEVRFLLCDVLIKLLKILPQERRTIFVKEYLNIWFIKLIPTVLNDESLGSYNTKHFEALELLAEELQNVEYSDNQHWEVLFGCIYNPHKYPLIMKNLLDSGNPYWHRLWIVFIKLLKNQITRSNTQGSPINALLPVVEAAFKMDVPNRCRAFKCWEVLIDNFSKETNEVYITKRLKLLIIPLHSNNAKVEETAIAKLHTWWHLIRKFESRINKFFDSVLIAFLNFCFGKNVSTVKATFVPGLISSNVKKNCVEAFINIAGHLDCPGCGSLPRLEGKLINTQVLVCNWGNFAYCLRKAIIIAADDSVGVTVNQAQCLWKSFVQIIGDLPDNNVRRDIFNELLSVLEKLTQDSHQSATDNAGKIELEDLILNLVFSLFANDNNKIMSLLTTMQKTEGPMFKILSIILGPISNNLYNKNDSIGCVNKLKSVIKCILDEKMCVVSHIVNWLMKNLSPNDNTLVIWTALAESIHENGTKTESLNLNYILMWPLKNIDKFSDSALASSAWYNLCILTYSNSNSNVDQESFKLVKNTTITDYNKVFLLYASLAILKLKLIKGNASNIEKDIQVVLNAMSKIEEYTSIEKILLILVDTLILLTSKIIDVSNATTSEYVFVTTIQILTVLKQQSPDTVEDLLQFIQQLHKNIEIFVKSSNSLQLKQNIIVKLATYATVDNKYQQKEIIQLLNSCLCEIKDVDNSFYTTIKNSIDGLGSKENKSENSKQNNNFTTPNTKAITRKAKKKEASIVNTVVENGEEYVVVKSNWKFNPRKLTENQKEKLQRKRDDIPALYQDLSQSQDEFKMATWKADSQDSSTTMSSKSNSKTSDDPASILKFIPSSEVVPKIIDNIFSESASKANTMTEQSEDKLLDNNTSKSKQIVTKDVKSPRVALKDRVFRNVRNLIEKSSLPANGKDRSESLIQIENVPKTPVSTVLNISKITNSAPPKVNTERPSRVKRKPKKLDDVVLFGLKKRRNSLGCNDQNDSQGGNELSESRLDDCNMQGESIKNVDIKEDKQSDIVLGNKTNLDTNMEIVDDPLNKPMDNRVVEKLDEKEDEVIHIKDDVDGANVENKNSDINLLEKEKNVETSSKTCDKDKNSLLTPKTIKKKDSQESSIKKSTTKKSRIEKELAIDMVEGHPFLKTQTEKRLTRKNLNNSTNNSRRTSLAEKNNKSKSDIKTPLRQDKKKDKDKIKDETNKQKAKGISVKSEELKEDASFESIEDAPCSEDVIESSQDSTVTTISVKSTKSLVPKKTLLIENVHVLDKRVSKELETQNLLDTHIKNSSFIDNKEDSKEDIEIPKNKTAEDAQGDIDLTETMDTEPFDSKVVDEIIVISDDVPIISLDTDVAGPETQELAEADTLPNIVEDFIEHPTNKTIVDSNITTVTSTVSEVDNKLQTDNENKTDLTIAETTDSGTLDKDTDVSSPFKDDVQRKQDFLDNTFEISPIKTMSPDRDKKSPSPETSSDYVVIKLSSPVQSNGEPFDKCDSPEIFTEDKISPDKRNQSPPREEVAVTNTSPSSSLSLKKNRPQVRSGGRAAQMLGLCVPDRLQTLKNSERFESEEPKRSPSTTPARRNLRILYNSVGDNSENSEENEDSDNFLKLKRSLPTADSSPSVPILKRKLAEIIDEATVSPASKRKRVSFHDPPVSTTVSVHKYIEPCGVRSPQNSALKRQERQLRSQTNLKSPKRLDTAFKLDMVLNKAVESFDESQKNASVDDTQMTSLDETPVVEIVKTSDLNDAYPICPNLVDCSDPIDAIASELSSPATKIMFLKELEGEIITIGDLAKMTELEVNRLCIKAPKVKVAKKVLSDYASKKVALQDKELPQEIMEVEVPPKEIEEIKKSDAENQTNVMCVDMEIQTNIVEFTTANMQTDDVATAQCHTQTVQSGSNSTEIIISSCLSERKDFILELNKNLPDSSKQEIVESLQFDTLKNSFMKKVNNQNYSTVITDVLKNTAKGDSDLSRLQTYLSEKYTSRQLILFCSELLRKLHDESMQD